MADRQLVATLGDEKGCIIAGIFLDGKIDNLI